MANPHILLEGKNEWFLSILAMIMFRGILVGVKLTEDVFKYDDFKRTFFSLWIF